MPDACFIFSLKKINHSVPTIISVQTIMNWIKVEQKHKLSGSRGQTEVITSDALKDECTIWPESNFKVNEGQIKIKRKMKKISAIT